jgi:GT2 family glycosyltransferase
MSPGRVAHGMCARTVPAHDVKKRRGGGSHTLGFMVDLPAREGPVRISVRLPGGHTRQVEVQHPAAPRGPRARRRLRRAFLRDMVRALPAFAAYALHRSDRNKGAIKAALGLTHGPAAPVLQASWLTGDAPPIAEAGPFTIVMPVHDGFDMLREALGRVRRHTNGDWRIIVVDDASTDPRVPAYLRGWVRARRGRAELLTLTENVGFVGAVNAGLARAEGRSGHVVLLNTDAHVPPDWAERLLAPLSDPRVASVTPFSNTAEIFSVPLAARSEEMTGALADRIDSVARRLSLPATLPSAPTGVGFCMAMSRDWLRRVPRLDPAFGRGYGEEVDWCQKVRALGARHVGTPGLFVHHVGGTSFGAEKAARLAAANAMICSRYPRYDGEVQDHLLHDPLRTARLALAIAWAGFRAKGPLPVYLAHGLGGGAEIALEREIARDLVAGGAALVLRVGGASRFTVELRLPEGCIDGATSCFGMVQSLLVPVPRLRVVYSCGVGDPAAIELPDLLLRLRRDLLSDRLEARLHDYFPLSPSYCLIGRDGRYRGPVKADNTDPAHRFRGEGGQDHALAEWQGAWRAFLSACDEITAYSRSSARIFAATYPELSHRVSVRPPPPKALPPRVAHAGKARALGVLGNLNAQKGAGVIAALARRLDAAGDPRPIVVIGNVDAAFALPARVRIHGGYDRDQIAGLTRRYDIAAWIVPAIWPETYSFSTREALATGLPVIAFDIGAQGEAVRAAPNGRTVPHDPDADLAQRLFAALPGPGHLARPGGPLRPATLGRAAVR